MLSLQLRMMLLVTVLFSIIYGIVVMIGTAAGVGNFYFYLIFAAGMMFVQYMIGPKMVEWQMKVRYIKAADNPELYRMVEDQVRIAGIPMPKVCISPVPIPNAFAFGRSQKDGRVCVTEGIMRLLNPDELRAVIGHELTPEKLKVFVAGSYVPVSFMMPVIMPSSQIDWYSSRTLS